MECDSCTQSDHCVLCASSQRLHSWRNSTRAYIGRVRQNGEVIGTYISQSMSERSRWLEETHPKIFEILASIGHNSCSTGGLVLDKLKTCCSKGVSGAGNVYRFIRSPSTPSVQQIKGYIMNNMIKYYFVFGTMLIIGSFLYFSSLTSTSSIPPLFSVWFYVLCGILIWVPILYWWRLHKQQNELDNYSSEIMKFDKPPPYESLSLVLPTSPSDGEAPPSYEDILTDGHDRSDCGFIGVPICAVHQPVERLSTNGVQNITDTNVHLCNLYRQTYTIQEPNSQQLCNQLK